MAPESTIGRRGLETIKTSAAAERFWIWRRPAACASREQP
jgi:hypothetical protein